MELVHERVGCTRKTAIDAVETVFAIIKESLRRGERVKVSGFGSFAVNHKRSRRGRNPQTGAEIVIDSRIVLSFKPSQALKDRVDGGE